MRDPLYWMPIKYKLSLAFVALGLFGFGVGGFLVSRYAEHALEGEITRSLESATAARVATLEADLDLLGQRLQDFASDGLIRRSTIPA